MRLLIPLTLASLLLLAPPAPAQITDDLGSEQQTEGYGRLFAYVGGGVGAIAVLLFGYLVFKQMVAETQRGKKTGWDPKEILDEKPKVQKKRDLYLGEKVPEWKVQPREEAIKAAFKFLAREDKAFSLKRITALAEEAFVGIKTAIEVRSAKGVKALLTKDYLASLRSEVKKHREEGDRHVFHPLEVTGVAIVHFEAPKSRDNHTFTALISATSRDFYQDDKTKEVLRGDKEMYSYQEFLRFRRSRDGWLVEALRSSSDMDRIINAKNVLAESDLAEFSKTAEKEHLREFVGK